MFATPPHNDSDELNDSSTGPLVVDRRLVGGVVSLPLAGGPAITGGLMLQREPLAGTSLGALS